MDPVFEYVDVGGGSVAYRRQGDAKKRTIVYLQTGTIPFESITADEAGRRILEGLEALASVILFDRRGIGLSDPLPDGPWAQVCWAQDLIGVIEAAASGPVIVFAQQFMDFVLLALGERPDLVESVVWYEPTTDWIDPTRPDKPRELLEASIRGEADFLAKACPSRCDDSAFRKWFETSGARGASPAVARELYRRATGKQAEELRRIAANLRTPLLVVRRPDSLAELGGPQPDETIWPKAEVRNVPGSDWHLHGHHLESVINAAARFITHDGAHVLAPRRILGAVLFTDIIESTSTAAAIGDARWKELISSHDTIVESAAVDHGGQMVKSTGDGALALLPSAHAALEAYDRIRESLAAHKVTIRAGVHVGDVDLRGSDISGLTVTAAARIMDLAAGDQLLVSWPVVASLLGSPFGFNEVETSTLKGLPGTWAIFEWTDPREDALADGTVAGPPGDSPPL